MHTGYAVRSYQEGGSDNLLGGITAQSALTGSEVDVQEVAGDSFARHVSVTQQNPGFNFTTLAVDAALGYFGTQGLEVDAAATETGLQLWQVSIDDDTGQPASGASHRSLTMSKGLVYPVSLSCAQDGHAELQCVAQAIYDGSNDPLIPAGSATLPGTLADTERWGLGAVSIGGVTVTDHLNIELAFGLQVTVRRAEGDLWPTHLQIVSIKPRLTVSGAGVELFAAGSFPLAGKAATQANTTVYLRKRDTSAAGYVTGSNHISFNLAGLATIQSAHDASGNDLAQATIQVDGVYDGSNAPVVFNSGVSLP